MGRKGSNKTGKGAQKGSQKWEPATVKAPEPPRQEEVSLEVKGAPVERAVEQSDMTSAPPHEEVSAEVKAVALKLLELKRNQGSGDFDAKLAEGQALRQCAVQLLAGAAAAPATEDLSSEVKAVGEEVKQSAAELLGSAADTKSAPAQEDVSAEVKAVEEEVKHSAGKLLGSATDQNSASSPQEEVSSQVKALEEDVKQSAVQLVNAEANAAEQEVEAVLGGATGSTGPPSPQKDEEVSSDVKGAGAGAADGDVKLLAPEATSTFQTGGRGGDDVAQDQLQGQPVVPVRKVSKFRAFFGRTFNCVLGSDAD